MSAVAIDITFPEGLAAFPEQHRFQLLDPAGEYPMKFLHALDAPELSFVCMATASLQLDYAVPLTQADAAFLDLKDPADAKVLVLVAVPEDPRKMTANLAAPLVINLKNGMARQLALDPLDYATQFPVFGPKQDVLLTFPDGLIGFEDLKTFRLFEPQGAYPLKFLQSVDREDVSFSCIDVPAIVPDYAIQLGDEDARMLALEEANDAMILALVVIPEDPRNMTANLAGPVVINVRTRVGRQVVQNTETYSVKHRVLGN